jgi:hypothetical protein
MLGVSFRNRCWAETQVQRREVDGSGQGLAWTGGGIPRITPTVLLEIQVASLPNQLPHAGGRLLLLNQFEMVADPFYKSNSPLSIIINM